MTELDLIQQTAAFVQEKLRDAEAGHDWWHIQRVWNNTKLILETEEADALVCELTALLHDIADSKFHDGDEQIGPRIAGEFLQRIGLDKRRIEHVQQIISNMSYKASLGQVDFHSKELEIVQDADRLDAIGAIGIARAFQYGGFKNREIYNPNIPPQQQLSKEAYKNTTAPTINHFYEKLLLLRDKMNTTTAKQIAAHRHLVMESFLQQFYSEWNGES
ncbi:HD domain-containing protein [Sphingobacterium corticibacterium]|uniref:HD domain-containing protein n=1 Tax=Sphingobacterium corticibacterium TaxID=2484746 RepID=A0A4Q6XFW4_9SPHI|nr:HD domain-containing protein [Sphingobacterium corticibacterium]RZF58363.1 HD domain-containing protein [Sphingobacterium corticibacterium]